MTIYDVQNAQKTPIWKQQIIECRSSGMSVKEWCKERGLDFTTYYRWGRKILTSIISTEDMPCWPAPNLPPAAGPQNAIPFIMFHQCFSVSSLFNEFHYPIIGFIQLSRFSLPCRLAVLSSSFTSFTSFTSLTAIRHLVFHGRIKITSLCLKYECDFLARF